MAVYTHLSTEEIAAFINRYALGKLMYAKGMAEGVENSNYLLGVVDPKGKEARYIFTIYEQRVRSEDLPFFLSVMEHLASRGFPCPVPLHAKDGGAIQHIKGKACAIITFLPGGGSKEVTPLHASLLGEAAAKLHRAGENFDLARPNALSLPGWQGLFHKTASRLNTIEPDLENMVKRELEFLAIHWPKAQTLPQGVIHADLFPDNVFFNDGKLSGVIDFYFACNDFLAYEVAICMNAWCFEPQETLNIAKARALLAAYDKIRPLHSTEKDALPLLARGASLRFLLTRAHDKLFPVEGAVVTQKDPLEYANKLRFHQKVRSHHEYGI